MIGTKKSLLQMVTDYTYSNNVKQYGILGMGLDLETCKSRFTFYLDAYTKPLWS